MKSRVDSPIALAPALARRPMRSWLRCLCLLVLAPVMACSPGGGEDPAAGSGSGAGTAALVAVLADGLESLVDTGLSLLTRGELVVVQGFFSDVSASVHVLSTDPSTGPIAPTAPLSSRVGLGRPHLGDDHVVLVDFGSLLGDPRTVLVFGVDALGDPSAALEPYFVTTGVPFFVESIAVHGRWMAWVGYPDGNRFGVPRVGVVDLSAGSGAGWLDFGEADAFDRWVVVTDDYLAWRVGQDVHVVEAPFETGAESVYTMASGLVASAPDVAELVGRVLAWSGEGLGYVWQLDEPIVPGVNPRVVDDVAGGDRGVWLDTLSIRHALFARTDQKLLVGVGDGRVDLDREIETERRRVWLLEPFLAEALCTNWIDATRGCDPDAPRYRLDVTDLRPGSPNRGIKRLIAADQDDIQQISGTDLGLAWSQPNDSDPARAGYFYDYAYWNPDEPLEPGVNPVLAREGARARIGVLYEQGLLVLVSNPDDTRRLERIDAVKLVLATDAGP